MLTVAICTYNPREDYLQRTLEGLVAQTLPQSEWELLLIDNASSNPLNHGDISWHSNARQIHEPALGLTKARVRAIREAKGDLLVFVDDDNVLAPDYLAQTQRVAREWAILGAWGGVITPEFETTPPEWTKRFWPSLAIRELKQDVWSNAPFPSPSIPCGAGMTVRKSVAAKYASEVINSPIRLDLDRKGADLASFGDTDLASTSLDVGLGTGVFTFLHVRHLLPAHRLSEEYLLQLHENMTLSRALWESVRGTYPVASKPTALSQLRDFLKLGLLSSRDRKFEQARRRALRKAAEKLAGHDSRPRS